MTTDSLRERLERIYPEGSFGDAVVKLHRDAERLLGREAADQMAQECFDKIDAARDYGLRVAYGIDMSSVHNTDMGQDA